MEKVRLKERKKRERQMGINEHLTSNIWYKFCDKGPFINDVTQVRGRGVSDFMTLCMKEEVIFPF